MGEGFSQEYFIRLNPIALSNVFSLSIVIDLEYIEGFKLQRLMECNLINRTVLQASMMLV